MILLSAAVQSSFKDCSAFLKAQELSSKLQLHMVKIVLIVCQ